MNEDFRDLPGALLEAGARFLVVGALTRFGAPLAAMGISRSDFLREDQVVQIGLPPRRIDVLTSIAPRTARTWKPSARRHRPRRC